MSRKRKSDEDLEASQSKRNGNAIQATPSTSAFAAARRASGQTENAGLKAELSTDSSGAEVVTSHPCRVAGCRQEFRSKTQLRTHARQHDRPHTCSGTACEARFGSKVSDRMFDVI